MRVAVDAGIPGIVAECGGSCACATCHVYVDPAWTARLPPPNEGERAMLEAVAKMQSTSRLSCQLEIDEQLDGLTVLLPESQY
jgi:2Fe-2S ferredoxin